ncbi:hypothetical protein Q4596_00375 [Pseudoalteromonas carrageenovora]|uniref:hypothetical protein n=1 Tax=Pseudoalteromonas carrageenovora TaxID=227 RepID=UPI0026E45D42|nr:hypothetical protein [Pseudoalteromonas carrageenovora]MDO6834054.1 hypothetical protein [Pseudoalteromonas carrageenovora]
MKRKLTLEYTRKTKDSEEMLKVEYDSAEQVNLSSEKKMVLVTGCFPLIVRELLNYIIEFMSMF